MLETSTFSLFCCQACGAHALPWRDLDNESQWVWKCVRCDAPVDEATLQGAPRLGAAALQEFGFSVDGEVEEGGCGSGESSGCGTCSTGGCH